jgi:hypothetical protein
MRDGTKTGVRAGATHLRLAFGGLVVAAGLLAATVSPASAAVGSDPVNRAVPAVAGLPAIRVVPAGPAAAAATFRLENLNAAASNRCLGIAGTDAGIYTCTNNPDQTWHWGAVNGGQYNQLINGNGKCLGVGGGSQARGARIGAFNCQGTGHPDQYWTFIQSEATNCYYLFNYGGLEGGVAWVAGVGGSSTANGAPVVLWDQELHEDQYWFTA